MQRVNGLWRRVLDEEIWEQLTKQRFGEHVKGECLSSPLLAVLSCGTAPLTYTDHTPTSEKPA